MSDAVETRPGLIGERPQQELSTLGKIEPPPAFVARVMTRLAEPRLPSLWQWLRRPFSIEIQLSPITLVVLALSLAAAFVFIGATLN